MVSQENVSIYGEESNFVLISSVYRIFFLVLVLPLSEWILDYGGGGSYRAIIRQIHSAY